MWDVVEVKRLLDSKVKVWRYLCEALGIKCTEPAKKALKTTLYAMFFGMRRFRLRRLLNDALRDSTAFDRFMQVDVIQALYRARTRKMNEIRAAGRAEDDFGNVLTTDQYKPRSISAQLMQSKEMMLLSPVLEIAEQEQNNSHGMSVMLYQHDGFSFRVHSKGDEKKWQDRLAEAVQRKAADMRICTELEFDPDLRCSGED